MVSLLSLRKETSGRRTLQKTSPTESSRIRMVFGCCKQAKPTPTATPAPLETIAQTPELQEKMNTEISAAISQGFFRRDPEHVAAIFQNHRDKQSNRIPPNRLPKALEEARVRNVSILVKLRATEVTSDDKGVNETEFLRLLQRSDPIQRWLASLPLADLIADALVPLLAQLPKDEDADGADVRTVSQLNLPAVGVAMKVAAEGLERVVTESIVKLRESYSSLDQRARDAVGSDGRSKFGATFKMSCGEISNFHGGLAERVGSPSLDFEKAMELEHCHKAGCDVFFTTDNYRITSTPAKEWAVTVRGSYGPGMDAASMQNGRVLHNIDELVGGELAKKAGLTRPEVIAVVLYTGPMFTIYNAILRRWPDNLYSQFKDGDNLYPTTIFVLVSAIQKVSRCMPIPEGTKLYRGMGGMMDLPDMFVRGDTHGCKGFTEWGFMSTTANKDIAVQYSGAQQGRPKAMVMVIEPNAVDRGACIKDFSQYPGEIEYLWVPCSYVQPNGDAEVQMTDSGVVTLLPVRVNANLKTETVEQLLGRKKSTHLTAFRTAIDDMKRSLKRIAEEGDLPNRVAHDLTKAQNGTWTADGFIAAIVASTEKVFRRHADMPNERFSDDSSFRAIIVEMLDSTAWGVQKLRLYLEDTANNYICFFQPASMRDSSRQYFSFLRQKCLQASDAATRLRYAKRYLQDKGRMLQSIDEKNTDGEVVMMAAAGDGWPTEEIEMVIAAGVDVNKCNSYGWSPVKVAAQNGHLETIRALVEAGADVNICDNQGWSPLKIASQNGHHTCVACMLEAGADVNRRDNDGWTALMTASQNGHLEVIKALIAAGADVNLGNHNNWTPLKKAAQNGRVETVRVLIAAGADVNKADNDGWSPIMAAAQNGHAECTKVLIENGADFNKADNKGWWWPLKLANTNGHTACADVLRGVGARS